MKSYPQKQLCLILLAILFGFLCINRNSSKHSWIRAPASFDFMKWLFAENTEISTDVSSYPLEFCDLPPDIKPSLHRFQTWSREHEIEKVWRVYPETEDQVVKLVHWVFRNEWKVRASGMQHTWAPLTVTPSRPNYQTFQYNLTAQPFYIHNSNFTKQPSENRARGQLLMKTQKLNRFAIISKSPGYFSFWAQPGIKMEDLISKLEENGMGFLHYPAIGDITLGGVLAVGGHGTGIPAKNETLTNENSYGSLSSLILSLTAVVYDKRLNKYVAKEVKRSDPDFGAFIVNLGRTFITNVTMSASPLQYLRCQSFMDISNDELFGDPEHLTSGQRSLSHFLDESGRVEVVHLPFTRSPWLKVWTVLEPHKDVQNLDSLALKNSNFVQDPYNYKFTHSVPACFSVVFLEIPAKILCRFLHWLTDLSLSLFKKQDLFGPSKSVFLYVKSSTLRYHASGWAIISARKNVQKSLHKIYAMYKSLLEEYENQGMYPINGPLEIRVVGVDSQSPQGSISPSSSVEGRPDLDTVVYVNVFTFPNTPFASQFLMRLETEFLQICDGKWAVFRPEWSKGWGYSENGPWTNRHFLQKIIPSKFDSWKQVVKILQNYDPGKIFTNEFLSNDLLI